MCIYAVQCCFFLMLNGANVLRYSAHCYQRVFDLVG